CGLKVGKRRMAVQVHFIPIIETGALQGAAVQAEAEPADQMQRGTGGGAKAGDIAGVWWNFRFPKRDVQPVRPSHGGNLNQTCLIYSLCGAGPRHGQPSFTPAAYLRYERGE